MTRGAEAPLVSWRIIYPHRRRMYGYYRRRRTITKMKYQPNRYLEKCLNSDIVGLCIYVVLVV